MFPPADSAGFEWCVVAVYISYLDMSCQLFGPYSFQCLGK